MIDKLVLQGIEDGPHLLITAGIHGDEYEPMEAVRRVYKIVEVLENQLKGTLTLVPVVNKPAFELANRTGPDGKDLARICPGDMNGSESEQIAHEISGVIRSADFYIDMHNGGVNHNIFPFTGYILHPDNEIRETQRELAKAFLLPIVWGTDPTFNGRTLSVARDAKIPAIYTEIGGQGIYDESYTMMAVEGCLNVLRFLKMISGILKSNVPKYHLEDHRPNSGHLQRLLPAPCDGFFIPRVTFGDRVITRQILGDIQNDLGHESTPVRADQDGIVFILRSVPSVKKGDPLGAILPVSEHHKMQSIYE